MQTPPPFSTPVAPALPPPMRVRFAAIGEAWDLIRQDWTPWVVAILVLIVASYAAEFLVMPIIVVLAMAGGGSSANSSATGAGVVIVIFLLYALMLALIAVVQGVMSVLPQRLAMRRLRGFPSGMNDLFALDGMFWRIAAWSLLFAFVEAFVPFVLVAVAAMVGGGFAMVTGGFSPNSHSTPASTLFVVCMVAAYAFTLVWVFFAQALFAFVPLLIIDQRLGVFAAAKLSAKTLGPHVLPMLGVYICAALVSGVGGCACGVGVLVTGSILFATIGVIYNDFFRPAPAEGQPIEGWYPRPG